MKRLNHIRRHFVRQLTDNDCGIAALAMILNYTGSNAATALRANVTLPEGGFSLLGLRYLANSYGLSARCVQMEIDFLRKNHSPCILHMINEDGNNHFQVCYGARKGFKGYTYLMADPARQVYYLNEGQLEKQWVNKAALYFENLSVPQQSGIRLFGNLLFLIAGVPKGLLITIPFLNICTVALGLTLSWLLQRGVNDPLVTKKESLIAAVVLLLLTVTLSKGLFSYLKQRIQIMLNYKVNQKLVLRFIDKVTEYKHYYRISHNIPLIKRGFLEIQKMQNAVAVFLSVLLSDGSLIVLILSVICYCMPLAGLINLAYLVFISFVTIKSLPGLLYDYASLNELSGVTENNMINQLTAQKSPELNHDDETVLRFHNQNHTRYLNAANIVAVKISKMNLFYDWSGTVNVILIFAFGLLKLSSENMEYSSFVIVVILSYFITNIMPRICSALFVITEGIDASYQYKAWQPRNHSCGDLIV